MSGLSLTEWLFAMGVNPWHCNQLVCNLLPLNAKCDTITYEQSWMWADRAGRKNIRDAIEEAEQLLFQYQHVWPSPRFRTITLPYPQPLNKQTYWRGDYDLTGRWMSLNLPEGYVSAAGYEHDETPVVAALTFADLDSDTLFETATCTALVPSGTTAEQVAVQFLAADCGPVTPQPQIKPRSVSVSGINATITFNAWDLVKPIKTCSPVAATYDPLILPPTATTPYAASVEVYRKWCDPGGLTDDTAQAVLIWETAPWPSWAMCCWPSGGSSADPAALATALARVTIRDGQAGIVALGQAAYSTTLGQWVHPCDWSICRAPDRVLLRYQAGIPLTNLLTMAEPYRTVVARLAAAELERPICACTPANKELGEWQLDVTRTGATDEIYQAPEDATNPLGPRRGHLQAWRHIKNKVRTVGILAG